jgi:hypothetical protein
MENKDPKKNPSLASDGPWSALGFAWELGYSIAIPLVLFALGGRYLDKKLSTSPWLLLGGLALSIVLTSIIVYYKVVKEMKNL